MYLLTKGNKWNDDKKKWSKEQTCNMYVYSYESAEMKEGKIFCYKKKIINYYVSLQTRPSEQNWYR